ncbi:MAG: RagB/SusD family nutrient uptake outer membrane protein [Candidatus Cryptobacteroides sp.]
MTYRNKTITALILLCAGAASCVDLDTVSKSDMMSNNMWTTEELVDAAVAGIYKVFVPDPSKMYPNVETNVSHLRPEVCGFASIEMAHTFFLNSPSYSAGDSYLSNEWKALYTGVSRCNDALHNLPSSAVTGAKRARLIAECKFMRAWFYTRLNMLFNGVPVYLSPITASECTKGQSSPDEVWEVVLKDIQDCLDEPEMPLNTLKTNYGRPSKGAAYALRGMIYMWTRQYSKAIPDFEEVGKCGYGLWEGKYIDLFKEQNEKSKEMILPVQCISENGYADPQTQQIFGNRSTLQGVNFVIPSSEFVDSYQNADGSEFSWSQIFPDWDKLTPVQREVFFVRDGMNSNSSSGFQNQKNTIVGRVSKTVWDNYYLDNGNQARIAKAYSGRDPRLMQTIFTPSSATMTYANTGGKQSLKTFLWPYINAGNGDSAGDLWSDQRQCFCYMYRKFVVTDNNALTRDRMGMDWPLMRYTDVWLLYAEALNEVGRMSEAISAVNKIRQRAGMPLLTEGGGGANGVTDKEDMLRRIQYERRVELCAEGVNYFDEVRWGTLKQMKFKGQDSYDFTNMWGTRAKWLMYFRNNMWPWAVPLSETQRNPNLTPTDGWNY